MADSPADGVGLGAHDLVAISMNSLHALWDHAVLHLFAIPRAANPPVFTDQPSPENEQPSPVFVPHDKLRSAAADMCDGLLIASATDQTLDLTVPEQTSPIQVPTISFRPDDAIDLLWRIAPLDEELVADSMRYWSRAAQLVRELLAKQRYVPAVARASDDYRAYWRPVLAEDSLARVSSLVSAMPAICTAFVPLGVPPNPEKVLDSFIVRTLDASVRRCMENDELAQVLRSNAPSPGSGIMVRWLQGLVTADPVIHGTQAECGELYEAVSGWIGRVIATSTTRWFQTGMKLHPPSDRGDVSQVDHVGLWRLTFQLVSREDPANVIEVTDAARQEASMPGLLPQRLQEAIPLLREDFQRAARYFHPLAICTPPDGPLEVWLSLSEAYAFLREAAPLLRSEGFVIFAPDWWADAGVRPRMRLMLRPEHDGARDTLESIRLDDLVHYDWAVALGDELISREDLTALAESKAPLVQFRGRWMELPAAEFEIARSFIEQHGSGTTTLFEALRQCYLSDDLNTGLPFGGIRAQGWLRAVLDATDASAIVQELPAPAGFRGELRPYQLRGLQWLAFMSRIGVGACLADDMGLGKTIQLIALLLHEREAGEPIGPTLLVGPMSLVGNWQREIQRFAPSLKVLVHHGLERLTGPQFIEEASRHDVVISTYALTHRDFEHLSGVRWRRIALDEAQSIKNPAAKQSAAVRLLPAAHRVALTGTPVENRLSELWSIMDFLNPGYLGTATDFRRRLAVPIERYQDADRANTLRTLIKPFILRRLKKDPLVQVDLPPKMEMRVFCNLTREQAALYEAVVSDMLKRVGESAGIQRRGLILATLTKLKQICNHPVHFLGDATDLADRSGKCSRLSEMLGEVLAEGDQALVFTQYREMGSLLVPFLKRELGSEPLFLHGGTTRDERDRLVEQFQSAKHSPILILSLKAGGFGLNLTAAAHVFHFDRWWNPAVEDQATDRAHRIGQFRTVQVHKFVCIGTLEERIDALLEQKRKLAEQIIGSGEAWLTELSTDQFRELITLSQDAVGE